ncbi:MAG TPA: BTAD domain-containing putative transcriptional regulator [Gaiellaceae bacterium]|nr:BTAD domain-containing putative transcriptional regulator [Gaiellaceae bacterium]
MLDFRILGPLEVRDGEEILHLGGSKQRGVLAILLLSANEVVSSDRLVDRLWGDAPPEDAATALQAHVSRLRKALPGGTELLVTRAPGYMLQLAPGQLDLERFDALVREGRAELAQGAAERAATTLRSALELWRGRPLADLEDEPFAREATAHLEDAWLDAIGTRVDADLALGRHTELVTELRALARAHPLREGLRVQLMLALYRSGRQAEALDVYTDTRGVLNAELGLEPGPALQRLQQQILVQDPELDPPPSDRPARRRRRRGALVLVIALLAVVAGVGTAAVVASGPDGPATEASGGALVAIDVETARLGPRVALGTTPTAVAVGDGAVWVLDADTRTISRYAPESDSISTFATGATPTDLAVGAGAVWVGNGRRLSASQFVGPVATSVARLDPDSRTERATVELPQQAGSFSNQVENHLAVTDDALWAVAPDFSIARIDAASSVVTNVARPFPVQAVAAGPAGVWALGVDGAVARLDPETAEILVRTRIPAASVAAIGVGADAAWVTSPTDGTLWRVDAGDKPTLGSVDVGAGANDVATGDAGVWIANPLTGVVTQVSTETNAVVRAVQLGGIPRSLALDGERVWVTLSNLDTPAVSKTHEIAGFQPLPAIACDPPVFGGEGDPDVLIASDLMLQGGARITTTQMAQAIAFVLRQRHFRAGDFKVAYQSCDDSIATTGLFDVAKCAANARAYAANPDLVGVVGTFNSPCAAVEIPVLNRAANGGVAMVSPSNSYVGLTRAGVSAPAEDLAKLYPTGRRNYVRVSPTDDMQMAALALVAKRLGHRRVVVLDDADEFYGGALALAFDRAARRLGLRVVMHESWDPQARSYRGLVDAVARARPHAVVLSGLLDTNGAQVVRELRERLGPDLTLLANEGFTPISLLLERAGDAGRGVYVSLNGLTIERLGPEGRRFVRAFAETQPGAGIEPSTVYAAQAAQVLLDAIARSDGTRGSVIRELFRTDVRGGLIGDFTFDENGDISQSPITILQAQRGGGANTILSFEGARIVRIERPQASLVR